MESCRRPMPARYYRAPTKLWRLALEGPFVHAHTGGGSIMTNSGGRLPIRFTTPVSGPTFEAVLEQAQAAEAAGFSGVSFSDRPHDPILDGWTLATAVAARTERIRLYHTTLNIPYRYPAVLAKEAATLDIVSHGRLDL